ncbi:c-type cytochrome biogenesis protein CcmI [Microbulbifer pacificus]|uniref:C-type cytochrome biogenesis protein CcmI n=1 Tax=Microbulbifer pacificus TaxID=407164 RepID=A0AAU0MYP5_9GAMM|nr:c-type cytochrome biogenesis protein CcmI [Microbulbifer pacificus]WOX05326.1 c-type cytochrome biogenesis protein CcmI [Microbulbifer pacificus]
MIDLWLILALLLLPLAAIIAWPLLRPGKRAVAPGANAVDVNDSADLQTQTALYREHLAELEASRASGAVDEAQYQSLKADLARKLLAEEGGGYRMAPARQGGRGLLFALAFLLPFVAVGLYFYWGSYNDLALYRDIAASQTGKTDLVAEARITQQLRARADSHPEDLTSRYVLAQRLLVSNDLNGAIAQYRYIVAREPQAVNVRAELAQALFFASGSQMSPEVVKEVALVLEAQPNNTTALGLAGIAAFEREDFAAARAHWQSALAQMPAGSSAAQALSAGVARAEQALAEAGGEQGQQSIAQVPAASASGGAEEPAVPAGENRIAVKVTLPEGVQVSPDTPVFIYARTEESPMPLAIVRLAAADLPAEVVLDESRAMMPGRSLKTVDQVQLVARLAINGNARPAPGDWQGEIKMLPRSDWSKPVHIAIDQQM